MTSAEILALAALVLFFAVSLWLGLTGRDTRPAPAPVPPILDRAVFIRRPLLTAEQGHLFAAMDAALAQRGDGHRALPQAPLAALLEPMPSGRPGRDSATAIAARRIDVAILDHQGRLTAAVTLHSPDAITGDALRRAGIPLITTSTDDPDLDRHLADALGPAPALKSA